VHTPKREEKERKEKKKKGKEKKERKKERKKEKPMLVSEQDFCFKSLNQKFTVKCSWRTARHEKFEPRPKFSGGL